VVSVVAVNAPVNVIVPVVSLKVSVVAFTVLENVVPADREIVICTAPPDPTAPVTLIVPDVRPVFKAKCFAEPSIVPPKLIFPFDVVVNVWPAAVNVTLPV